MIPDPAPASGAEGGILDALDSAAIQAHWPGHFPLPELRVFEEIDSTNAWLGRARRDGARGPLICCADFQMAGRGRRGRSWIMPPRAGLAMSILWNTSDWPLPDPRVALAAGVVVVRCLESLGARGLSLKWPNDVLLDGRKLAGLLIEASQQGGDSGLILGLGLNLRLPEDLDVGQAHADLLASGIAPLPSRNRLAALLLHDLLLMLTRFPRPGFADYHPDWLERDASLGRRVRVSGAHSLEGRAAGVDELGRLCIDVDGRRHCIESGEISLRECP